MVTKIEAPFKKPIIVVISIQSNTVGHTGQFFTTVSTPSTMPVIVTCAPIYRSIPPTISTMANPTARIPVHAP